MSEKGTCSFESCSRPVAAKGVCGGHYQQQRKGLALSPLQDFSKGYTKYKGVCEFESCAREKKCKGFCDAHYRQYKKGQELSPIGSSSKPTPKGECSVEECYNVAFCTGLCRRHYTHKLDGKELKPFPSKVKDTICSFAGCDRLSKALDLCSTHHAQALRGEDLRPIKKFVKKEISCAYCGQMFLQDRASRVCCSVACNSKNRSGLIRTMYNSKDWSNLIKTVKERSVLQEDGCWVWETTDVKGYPFSSNLRVHRVVLEAKEGGVPLGVDQAHHVCANASCVNPDHLQRVSVQENLAEMNQRNYYIRRIAELEAMLAERSGFEN